MSLSVDTYRGRANLVVVCKSGAYAGELGSAGESERPDVHRKSDKGFGVVDEST